MKKKFYTLLILSTLFFVANAQEDYIDVSKTQTLRLDPRSTRGLTVSQLFDEVKFVPLETTPESLFGRISRLEVANNCYIISDQDTYCILLFNLDGSFKTKIKLEKKPFNFEYRLIDEPLETKIFVQNGLTELTYDLNGKLLKKEDIKQNEFKRPSYYLKPEGIEVNLEYILDDKVYEIAALKDGKVIYKVFQHERDYISKQPDLRTRSTYPNMPNELFFTRPFEYNIYRISPKGIKLDYKLIFPSEFSLAEGFTTVYDNYIKRSDFKNKNRKIFYGLSNPIKSGNYLFFGAKGFVSTRGEKRDFVYNFKTNSLIALVDIEPDALSYYLPVTSIALNPDFSMSGGFSLFKNNYMYTSFSSLDMKALKDQNPNKNVKYNSALAKYFENYKSSNNPVLVVLKPKKD
ncbi:6-bladed beta-propeller [Pedobacter sp. Du54]|uniref:6-bladed beta-propeller n=1 Tax=Pedobacter anseongensis TaxID=3133439 RepID=UPI0030AB171F